MSTSWIRLYHQKTSTGKHVYIYIFLFNGKGFQTGCGLHGYIIGYRIFYLGTVMFQSIQCLHFCLFQSIFVLLLMFVYIR